MVPSFLDVRISTDWTRNPMEAASVINFGVLLGLFFVVEPTLFRFLSTKINKIIRCKYLTFYFYCTS